ncbi:MAG: adenylate/guanylate cyclase domain-containing protein [Pseudomonadota bacterium]
MTQSTLAERRFAEADAQAEKLLGYVRMGVAALLAASILMAALSAERPEDAVLTQRLVFAMMGMAAYFLVGLAAIVIVKSGWYRPGVAWAAAFFDVGLILWNFYGGVAFVGVDPLFAMAMPAAFMVPLVLTFGALRFRPEIQVAATIFAIGALALIVFASPAPDFDPIASMRQVKVSHGAPPNAIRILIVLSLGLIVALAVWRARRLLERVIAEAEARANLTRFLPEGVADDMSDEAVARLRAARRAMVGVLFIDIRGFTAMAEGMGPEASGEMLTSYRAAILDAARDHDGVVDKFIGDGALVLFGLGERDGAGDAVAAAETLAKRFADAPFRVGIGVHYGEAMVGAVGDDRRLEFTVIGDVVNVASRIEALTKEEAVVALASAAALEAAPRGGWSPLGPRVLRGREAPVALFAFDPT